MDKKIPRSCGIVHRISQIPVHYIRFGYIIRIYENKDGSKEIAENRNSVNRKISTDTGAHSLSEESHLCQCSVYSAQDNLYKRRIMHVVISNSP